MSAFSFTNTFPPYIKFYAKRNFEKICEWFLYDVRQ